MQNVSVACLKLSKFFREVPAVNLGWQLSFLFWVYCDKYGTNCTCSCLPTD